MTVYQINQQETWTLAVLFNLPIQEGSVIGEWLGGAEIPPVGLVQSWTPSAMSSLETKGYYDSQKADERLPKDFLDALLFASIGQTQLSTIMRTSEQGVSTQFACGGSGLVQFGFAEDQLILHSPRKIAEMVPVLLPDWIRVEVFEQAKIKLPLGAFLFFKQACLLADMAFVINEDGNRHFTRADLVDYFMKSSGWIDVYHALGLENTLDLTEMPLAAYLQTLLVTQYLEEEPNGYLKIGLAGLPLSETLSDPDMVSFSLGMKSLSKNRTVNASFFFGNKRLFRMDMMSSGLTIEQVANVNAGQQWLKDLLIPTGVVNLADVEEQPPTIQPVEQQAVNAENEVNWQITILDGAYMNKTFTLEGDFAIGRGEQNNLTLLDGIASRKHALLKKTDQGFEIQDLGSANGTFLNGELIISPHPVWDGDLILIGGTNMRISGVPRQAPEDIMSAPTIFRP